MSILIRPGLTNDGSLTFSLTVPDDVIARDIKTSSHVNIHEHFGTRE